MDWNIDPYDRRKMRGLAAANDDLDLEQRDDARRRTHRLPLRLWTEGRLAGKIDFHNCSNISTEGMFIETPDPYPLGSLVMLEFNLPGVADPISVSGRVVTVLDEETAGPAIMGCGFQFEGIDATDAELISAYCDASQIGRR